jgi:hypothetical protein
MCGCAQEMGRIGDGFYTVPTTAVFRGEPTPVIEKQPMPSRSAVPTVPVSPLPSVVPRRVEFLPLQELIEGTGDEGEAEPGYTGIIVLAGVSLALLFLFGGNK